MTSSQPLYTDSDFLRLITHCTSADEVKQVLSSHNVADAESKSSELFKKLCCIKRQTKGIYLMAAGALMGFIGCLLSIVNPIPFLFDFALYGLTPGAVVVVLIGLYLFIEG